VISLGVNSEQPSSGKYIINSWAKSKSGSFYTPRRFFLPTVKSFGVKRSKFNFIPRLITSPKLATHYLPQN